MKDLKNLRKKIDKIDSDILVLLRKRFDIAKEIGKIKRKNGLKVVDKKREKEVFLNLKKKSRNLGINPDFIQNIFQRIIKQSRRVQK